MPGKNSIVRFFSNYSDVLLVSIWFGLAAGILEGFARLILQAIPGKNIRVSPEILWIAPAFNVILFLLMGAGLGLVMFRLLDKTIHIRAAVTLHTWVILFGAALIINKLHQAASLLLGLGVAFELGRRLQGSEQRMLVFFRRTVGVLAVVVLLAGVAGAMWDGWRERLLVRQLPPPMAGAPNVLLITLDTLRADHVSAHGYERPTTPNLDRLAEAGVLFESAFANSSWTLPAHASLFTGRLPQEHGADWEAPLDGTYPTLAEVLARRGYLTGAFSANTHYVTPESGLARGFAHFEVYGSSLADDAVRTVYGNKLALNVLPRLGYYDIPGRKRAAEVNREFLRWLDQVDGRPFFAFLNYFDLHDPYLTVDPYRTRFSPDVTRGDLINFQHQILFRRKPELSPAEIQMEINGYDGALAYMDAQLGLLFSELVSRGLDQNTLVIVASDHGEAFGNHNLFGHGNSLYLETLHVPLIFYWPGRIPTGVRAAQVVGLHQIPATVMELLDAAESPPFPGESLVRYWAGGADDRPTEPVVAQLMPGRFRAVPTYPTAQGELRSLITDRWQFILSETGQMELYDWREDPQEANNLADSPLQQTLVREFKRHLQSLATTESAQARRD